MLDVTTLDAPDDTPPVATTGHRQWKKTEDTRLRILTAAEHVFVEKGYWESNVADIVETSGCSVGSIYHHYGGKSELFIALWEHYSRLMSAATNEAIKAFLAENPDGPMIEAFCESARVYCMRSWGNRRGLSLFYSGDTPPGFERLRRGGNARWMRRNARMLGLGEEKADTLLTASLTALIGEACRIIIRTDEQEEAEAVADSAVVLIRRLFVEGGQSLIRR